MVLEGWGQRAVAVEVGGGLRSYEARGVPVLDGYAEDERCHSGRGQALLPWPNRLDGGRFEFDGVHEQAPLDEPGAGNAIHGLTRWLQWEVLDAATDRAVLGCHLHPRPGWAWPLELRIAYRLARAGLEVTVGARNTGQRRSPWAAGFHPYLAAPHGSVDRIELLVPASTVYRTDDRGLPTGTEALRGGQEDFSSPAVIGDSVLDHCYTGLARDAEGVATVVARDPVAGGSVTLSLGPAWSHVMVFTGDTVGGRARTGLAVEPMTGPANLLRSGESLVIIDPGEVWEGTFSISPSWLDGS